MRHLQLLQANGTKTSLISCLSSAHNASVHLKTTLDRIKIYKIDKSKAEAKEGCDLTNKAT